MVNTLLISLVKALITYVTSEHKVILFPLNPLLNTLTAK